MKLLSQRDPLWSEELIGKTKLKIRDFGCTITSLAMLTSYFKQYGAIERIPSELARYLKFTKEGLLIWSSVDNVCNFTFEWRQYGYDKARIDDSLKDPRKAVMLEFALGKGKHWVVALRRLPMTSIYLIADPLTGTKTFSTKYGKVTGSAHFSI